MHKGESFPQVKGEGHRSGVRPCLLGLLLGPLRSLVREEPGAFLLAALLPYQVQEHPARGTPAIASFSPACHHCFQW